MAHSSTFLCKMCVTAGTNMQFKLTNSQRYLVNAKPDTNHNANPTNPNGNSKR